LTPVKGPDFAQKPSLSQYIKGQSKEVIGGYLQAMWLNALDNL